MMITLGNTKLQWLGHASFRIKNIVTIYIDPYELDTEEKADIILITHGHYDHCSIKDLEKISTPETVIVATADCSSKLAGKVKAKDLKIASPGQSFDINGIKVEAVPAYNINKEFHPKGNEWVGYILTIENTRIYHAGDSDAIPEMKQIKADVALLPVGGTYTMNAEEAADMVNEMDVKKVVPMHFGSIVGSKDDAERFKRLVKAEVEILEKEE